MFSAGVEVNAGQGRRLCGQGRLYLKDVAASPSSSGLRLRCDTYSALYRLEAADAYAGDTQTRAEATDGLPAMVAPASLASVAPLPLPPPLTASALATALRGEDDGCEDDGEGGGDGEEEGMSGGGQGFAAGVVTAQGRVEGARGAGLCCGGCRRPARLLRLPRLRCLRLCESCGSAADCVPAAELSLRLTDGSSIALLAPTLALAAALDTGRDSAGGEGGGEEAAMARLEAAVGEDVSLLCCLAAAWAPVCLRLAPAAAWRPWGSRVAIV